MFPVRYGTRIKLILFLFAVLTSTLQAQEGNLVINPSFEEKVDFTQDDPALGWFRGLRNDTPDYITFTERGEPDFYYRKYIGGLLPLDGNAYTGIFCYRVHPLRGINEVREFIQVPLKKTLEKDTLYTISFYVALDPESNRAINNFNALFSSEVLKVKNEKAMYKLFPKVRFKRQWYDATTWTKVEQTYRGKGRESFLTIGNFSNDGSTGKKKVSFPTDMEAKWKMHELEEVAYYYVDMVSIIKASENREEEAREEEIMEILPDTITEDKTEENVQIELSEVKRDSSIVLNHIFFEFDKSDLLPESHIELDRLLEQLNRYPSLSITIEGHTDNLGTFEYNMDLSLARAKSVAEYMIGKGLEESRISFEGFGYTHPLSDNRTDKGRQMNRRVAFRIVKKAKN